MQAFTVEESILEGQDKVKNLFTFIQNNAFELDAYEMEKSIFKQLQEIGLAAMKCYFAKNGTGDIGDTLQMKDKIILKRQSSLRGKVYFSVFGKLSIPRTYYYKEGYAGIVPLDAQANLPKRSYSYLLQEWMDVLCIRDTFDESEVTLDRLLRLKISSSRFELISQDTSIHYDDFYNQKKKPEPESEGEINVIGFDGKGVPMIKSEAIKLKSRLGKGEKRQKKKEALVGVSYTIDRKIRTAKEVAENLVYPDKTEENGTIENDNEKKTGIRAKNIRRLASLKRSKKEVMKEIINNARNRDPEKKRPLVVVMDGALHLWTLISTLLCVIEYVGILDIIHVLEYLWDVANLRYGEKNPKGKKWVYDSLLCILKGGIEGVIVNLKQMLDKTKLSKAKREKIIKVINYFENHLPWMRYDEYLKAGYPIGTGVVESTCGHTVKDRMEGAGRRWSIDGAESILLLRSVYTSCDWDSYWNAHMSFEKDCFYGETIEILDNVYEFRKSEQADGSFLENKDGIAA
jgi:hypothetical protein